MREPVVVANWKMNTTSREAEWLARGARERLSDLPVRVILCPPFIWLDRVHDILEGGSIALGAQDLHWEEWGAYTGEVSPAQLRELCTHVIVGHSERRADFGETDEMVARKLEAAVDSELTPILVVGESGQERERGETEAVVSRQLRAALAGGVRGDLVVAYEPVWAIGGGVSASPEDAQAVASLLRARLGELGGDAARTPILYGGSVTRDTFPKFVGLPDVDGALVGGASLDVDGFAALVEAAATPRTGAER
jgi:triosephosphate isomerase